MGSTYHKTDIVQKLRLRLQIHLIRFPKKKNDFDVWTSTKTSKQWFIFKRHKNIFHHKTLFNYTNNKSKLDPLYL